MLVFGDEGNDPGGDDFVRFGEVLDGEDLGDGFAWLDHGFQNRRVDGEADGLGEGRNRTYETYETYETYR